MVEQLARTRAQVLRSNLEDRYSDQVTQVKRAQSPEPEADTYAHHEWSLANESVQELQNTDPRTWNIANRLVNPIAPRLEKQARRLEEKTSYRNTTQDVVTIHDAYIEASLDEQDNILPVQDGTRSVDYVSASNTYPNPIVPEERRLAEAAD